VLLAGFAALLSRIAGQPDVVIGSPIAGRTRSELEGLIGFFVNTLVLRCDLGGSPSFREAVRRVKEATLGAYAHQDLPFERLVEELEPERSLAYNPVFQVMFVLQNTPGVAGLVPDAEPWQVGERVSLTSTSKFDLTLFMAQSGEEIMGGFEYAADLFEPATVAGMADALVRLLAAGAAAPDTRLSALPLLGAAAEARILREGRGPRVTPPAAGGVHDLFAARARRTPGLTALTSPEGSLTYGELDRRSARLADDLRRLGAGPERRVGIGLARSAEFAVAVLAVLRAGAAYVPLDPEHPPARLALLAEDSAISLLLTHSGLAGRFAGTGVRVVAIDARRRRCAPLPPPAPDAGPEALAYLMYTSGSTGRPKGVAMPHRALLNLVAWQLSRSGDQEGVRTLLLASPGFDVSFQEAFSTWCGGGTLVVAPGGVRGDPAALLALLEAERVNRVFLPPFVLHLLARTALARGRTAPAGLHTVVTAGERLRVTPEIVRFLAAGGVELMNQYGPCETHVATEEPLRGEPDGWPPDPPVGQPIANFRAYVLDAVLRPVPPGCAGELYLGGAGLARGYSGRPAETAARFGPDPFADAPGARMYHTGDRARWRADGRLEFLGRVDDQVKVRGFRVEPGEVEAALAAHPGVRDAAVAAHVDAAGERMLVGYVVPAPASPPDDDALREWLRARLPEHMVPGAIVRLDSLPLSPNGKVDRRALPAPGPGRPAQGVEFVPPRSELEEAIAAIWREVLELERVGVHDRFFDVGGHSLRATQVLSRMEESLGLEIPLRRLFETPTVAGLALAVVEARAERVDPGALARLVAELAPS
jgi:amino acid adenylation domain-containing protein